MNVEEMAGHLARLEILSLIGYGHSSKAGPEFIAKLYRKMQAERDAALLQIRETQDKYEGAAALLESAEKDLEAANRLNYEVFSALRILAELHRGAEDCWYDDNNYCAVHLSQKPCIMVEVRKTIAKEKPTEKPKCDHAGSMETADGQTGLRCGKCGERFHDITEKRIPEQQIKLQHAKDCHCESCETHRKWYCPTCNTLMSSPESTRCVEGHDRRITR